MAGTPHSTHSLPAWAQEVLATSPALLSRREAATTARVSAKTIDRRIADGSLPAVHVGPKRVLVATRDLLTMLAGGALDTSSVGGEGRPAPAPRSE